MRDEDDLGQGTCMVRVCDIVSLMRRYVTVLLRLRLRLLVLPPPYKAGLSKYCPQSSFLQVLGSILGRLSVKK